MSTVPSISSSATAKDNTSREVSAATITRQLGGVCDGDKTMSRFETIMRLALGMGWLTLCSVCFAIVLILALPSRLLRIKIANHYGTWAGKGCAWFSGSSFQIRGLEHANRGRPAIYVSNHTSILDIFLGIWLSPVGTCGVGKKNVIYYPVFGQLYFLSGHLRLDRGNREKAIASLQGLARYVQKNRLSVFIWPEGTRSRDGRLQPMKKGAFHLALSCGLPIVPMVVTGAHRGWTKNTLALRRVPIQVEFVEPIDTSRWKLETLDAHMEEVSQVFEAHLPESQRRETLKRAA